MTSKVRVLDGRYRLGQSLGAGSMGSVFCATRVGGPFDGRQYAVKVLDAGAFSEDALTKDRQVVLRERFLREIKIVKDLQGPHIVRVLDAGEEPDGTLWLAMDRVSGRDLDRRIQTGPLEPRVALEIAAQVADALQMAHGVSVIHRDIKPSNLLIERLEPRPHVLVADFGIAKIVNDAVLTQTQGVGTPAYAAPEQFAGGEISPATDVCGLGRTLYALMTGTAPPAGGVALPLDGLPTETADILRRATAANPRDRLSMQRFEAELRELASATSRPVPREVSLNAALPPQELPPHSEGQDDSDARALEHQFWELDQARIETQDEIAAGVNPQFPDGPDDSWPVARRSLDPTLEPRRQRPKNPRPQDRVPDEVPRETATSTSTVGHWPGSTRSTYSRSGDGTLPGILSRLLAVTLLVVALVGAWGLIVLIYREIRGPLAPVAQRLEAIGFSKVDDASRAELTTFRNGRPTDVLIVSNGNFLVGVARFANAEQARRNSGFVPDVRDRSAEATTGSDIITFHREPGITTYIGQFARTKRQVIAAVEGK